MVNWAMGPPPSYLNLRRQAEQRSLLDYLAPLVHQAKGDQGHPVREGYILALVSEKQKRHGIEYMQPLGSKPQVNIDTSFVQH